MSLHVAVSGWLLGTPSGANRRLLGLLAAMRGRLHGGESVTVLHPRGFATPFAHPQVHWQPVAIPGGPTFRRVRAERRLLPGLLRELGAGVLDHGLLPAPRIPCPLCLTVHDVRDADGEGRRWRWLARAVLRTSLERAAAVVVPSRFTKARVLAHVADAPPIHVIANVASLPLARAAGHGWFLHVGHLEARKNLGLLVTAFAQLPAALRAQHPLRLAGADAGEGARLRRLAEQSGVQAQVQFAGPVSDDELAALYAGAVAVCVPSRHEGSGLCALEGLAAGRPVLVSDRGALPEHAGARVLPAGDPAPWTAAMAEAAAQPSPPRPTTVFPDPWLPAAATLLEVWRSLTGGLPARGDP